VAEPQRPRPAVTGAAVGRINREDIAAIVDKFLAGRPPEGAGTTGQSQPQPARHPVASEAEAGSMYAGPPPERRQTENGSQTSNAGRPNTANQNASNTAAANGNRTVVDFVSEDDVKRALQKGEKIYVNARTIITPAARDIGDPAEVFAKG